MGDDVRRTRDLDRGAALLHVRRDVPAAVHRYRRRDQRPHSDPGRGRRRPLRLVVDAEASGVKQPPSRQVWLACMGFLALLWLLPLYTMLANSLKTIREIAQSQYVLPPSGLELRNYVVALCVLRHGLVNSTLVALPATALAVLLGSWAGLFLSRHAFLYSRTVLVAGPEP